VNKRGYLTPNTGATEYLCRAVSIPIDDEMLMIAAVSGALLELTREWNWEQYGDMTPAETAEVMQLVYDSYIAGCTDCPLPYPYDIILDGPLHPVRTGQGGHLEELVDGEWVTPTGDYEVPAVPAREEATEEERRCLAAANAVFVLETLYETATDTFLGEGTDVAVYEAVLGALIGILGPWAGFSMASGIGLAFSAFLVFYELLETVIADVWTGDFSDDLRCLFYNCSDDTADVVTFDWDCIREGINELIFVSGGDLDKQLLYQQVLFILSIISVDGLNIAGAQTDITTADCDECGDFCWLFDFGSSNGGFSLFGSSGGFYDTSLTPDRWRAAQNWTGFPNRIGIRAHRTFSARFITRLEIDHSLDKIIGGSGDAGTIRLRNAGVVVFTSPGTIVDCGGWARRTDVYFPNVMADEILFGTDVHTNGQSDGCSGASGQYYCFGILMAGDGSNPIGTNNC